MARTRSRGASLFVTDPDGGLRCGRGEVDQSLVVGPGPCARPYVRWDLSTSTPSALQQGIAECEHALALDRNLAARSCPHRTMVRFSSVAPRKPRLTSLRPCASVRAIRIAYVWMTNAGVAKNPPRQLRAGGRVVSTGDRGQPKLSDSEFLVWPPPSRSLVDLTRRVTQSRPVSRSTRPSPSPAPAPPGRR